MRVLTLAHSSGRSGGATLSVYGNGQYANEEQAAGGASAPMRAKLAALEARAVQACGSGGGGLTGAALSTFRHALLCSSSEAAHVAVDEFCALARSGTPKNPPALLLSTLLRHRRLHGGELWRGTCNGKPLPVAEKERLHKLLAELDWSAMPADGKLRGAMADNSFKLGLSTKAWGKQNGPYSKFAFKEGMGVWDAASVTKKHAALWTAAGDLIRAVDPTYSWTSVQFNRNFRGSRHRDDKDASHQVATAFGDYTGGELRVHGQDGIVDVNTRDRYVRFDGRYEHEVLPYEGTRYSVIYFMLAPPWAVDPASTEEGIGMK